MAEAMSLSGIGEKTQVLHEALRSLIAREAGRRLAKLGGTAPKASAGTQTSQFAECPTVTLVDTLGLDRSLAARQRPPGGGIGARSSCGAPLRDR